MEAFLISIQKPHTDNIFGGIKTNEWRKEHLPSGHYYCYESASHGGCKKVIGEFDVVKSLKYRAQLLSEEIAPVKCGKVSVEWLTRYAGKNGYLWANWIRNAKRFDKPKELGEFIKWNPVCKIFADWIPEGYEERITFPPQTWCYVEQFKDISSCSTQL